MENTIKFKRSALATYDAISEPGKYRVKVQNNVSEKNLYTDENGKQRYIVSLRAIAADKLPQVREVFASAEEVEIEETNGLFMTASIWKNGEQDQPALPMKGEEVEINVGFVASTEGEEVLRATNIHVLPAKIASKFSLATTPVAEPAATLQHA